MKLGQIIPGTNGYFPNPYFLRQTFPKTPPRPQDKMTVSTDSAQSQTHRKVSSATNNSKHTNM